MKTHLKRITGLVLLAAATQGCASFREGMERMARAEQQRQQNQQGQQTIIINNGNQGFTPGPDGKTIWQNPRTSH